MNNEGKHWALGICRRWGRGVRMRASNPLCIGEQPMVALNEQFHHPGARPRLPVTGYGLQRGEESGVNTTDQGTLITDQKRRTSNDLFIDHYSLVIERRACANETIFCGYPDRPGFRGLDGASPQCRCLATPINRRSSRPQKNLRAANRAARDQIPVCVGTGTIYSDVIDGRIPNLQHALSGLRERNEGS